MRSQSFKKIVIGGVPKDVLIEQLKEAGIKFNEYAKILFEHPSFAESNCRETVSLVKTALSDIGLSNPAVFEEIVAKASELGLKLCPLSLGAHLRIEYLEQPEGPYLTVASEKPVKDEDYPNGFYLRNYEGALWFRGYRATEEYLWPQESEFVFIE
jgi:hypothetical protein